MRRETHLRQKTKMLASLKPSPFLELTNIDFSPSEIVCFTCKMLTVMGYKEGIKSDSICKEKSLNLVLLSQIKGGGGGFVAPRPKKQFIVLFVKTVMIRQQYMINTIYTKPTARKELAFYGVLEQKRDHPARPPLVDMKMFTLK